MKLKVKNKTISGVYKITNPFGDSYIGQSFDVIKRFLNHKKFISSNHHLSKSIRQCNRLI